MLASPCPRTSSPSTGISRPSFCRPLHSRPPMATLARPVLSSGLWLSGWRIVISQGLAARSKLDFGFVLKGCLAPSLMKVIILVGAALADLFLHVSLAVVLKFDEGSSATKFGNRWVQAEAGEGPLIRKPHTSSRRSRQPQAPKHPCL